MAVNCAGWRVDSEMENSAGHFFSDFVGKIVCRCRSGKEENGKSVVMLRAEEGGNGKEQGQGRELNRKGSYDDNRNSLKFWSG